MHAKVEVAVEVALSCPQSGVFCFFFLHILHIYKNLYGGQLFLSTAAASHVKAQKFMMLWSIWNIWLPLFLGHRCSFLLAFWQLSAINWCAKGKKKKGTEKRKKKGLV